MGVGGLERMRRHSDFSGPGSVDRRVGWIGGWRDDWRSMPRAQVPRVKDALNSREKRADISKLAICKCLVTMTVTYSPRLSPAKDDAHQGRVF